MKLIDKDALVAKIDDWRHNIMTGIATLHGRQRADAAFEHEILGIVRDFLDTLEVKEVDLDAEIVKYEESFKHNPASMGYKETAKHFFELGLKAQKGEEIWLHILLL